METKGDDDGEEAGWMLRNHEGQPLVCGTKGWKLCSRPPGANSARTVIPEQGRGDFREMRQI